jgi:hypothetical protein
MSAARPVPSFPGMPSRKPPRLHVVPKAPDMPPPKDHPVVLDEGPEDDRVVALIKFQGAMQLESNRQTLEAINQARMDIQGVAKTMGEQGLSMMRLQVEHERLEKDVEKATRDAERATEAAEARHTALLAALEAHKKASDEKHQNLDAQINRWRGWSGAGLLAVTILCALLKYAFK